MDSPPEPGPSGLDADPTRSVHVLGTFRAGDLLCERFRVVRFIARGGMGELYEAEDLTLGERVALKTIRSEIAVHERANQRGHDAFDCLHRVAGDDRGQPIAAVTVQGEVVAAVELHGLAAVATGLSVLVLGSRITALDEQLTECVGGHQTAPSSAARRDCTSEYASRTLAGRLSIMWRSSSFEKR